AVDQLLGLIEAGAAKRDRRRVIAGIAGLAIGVAVALTPLAGLGSTHAYTIGAKNFSEQYILAELMAERLERGGAQVSRKEDLGSAVAYRALAAGEIDAYVDYSGTLWTNTLNRQDNPGRAAVLAGITKDLAARDGVQVLGSLGFENAYALAMRADKAKALGIVSLDDLAREAPKLTFGADLEFLSRPEWKAIDAAYGLKFKAKRSFQPTFMYRALAGGDADVISAFSSDGRIAADKLVVLTDPKGAIPPYDAVILISPKKVGDKRLIETLRPLVGAIPVEAMRAANYSVDRDQGKLSPAQAARDLAKASGF
ncbi:glycine betaine ABC transporter substrate-binding protein, partial [Phenylobacterium sp.]|uniref:glycine betaine ABC transporter substrate-binding protein n=1 Tax=Phenylobacterium sp. TaxID=1871053 RepID=UPI0027369461